MKPVSQSAAQPTLLIDNDRTKVTKWRFLGPGDATGWHVHQYDYVVVPLFDGVLDIDNGEGNIQQVQLKHGDPYFRPKGVKHNVINSNDFECAFIEIEFL